MFDNMCPGVPFTIIVYSSQLSVIYGPLSVDRSPLSVDHYPLTVETEVKTSRYFFYTEIPQWNLP